MLIKGTKENQNSSTNTQSQNIYKNPIFITETQIKNTKDEKGQLHFKKSRQK